MKILTTQKRVVVIILVSLVVFGMVVKIINDHYNKGTDQITLISSNIDVGNFYVKLNENDIEFSGKVDINGTGIYEQNRSRKSEKRLLENN